MTSIKLFNKVLIHYRGIYNHTSIEDIRTERYYRRTECVHGDWIFCGPGSVLLLQPLYLFIFMTFNLFLLYFKHHEIQSVIGIP